MKTQIKSISRFPVMAIACSGLCLATSALAAANAVDPNAPKRRHPRPQKKEAAKQIQASANAMVKDHEKDLTAFQAEAKNGSDSEVKAFASKTSEVIKKHLAMVKTAQGKLK